MILLNAEEAKLKQKQEELALPSFPNLEALKEVISRTDHYENANIDKFLNLRKWLFSIQINHNELKTAIVYGFVHEPEELYTKDFDLFFNQPFYYAPSSFFASQAVSLSFSLSEKIAQFVNVLEDINLNLTDVSLYNFTNEDKIYKNTTLQNANYLNSQFLGPLRVIANQLLSLKELRNGKIHRAESELVSTTARVSDGLINDEPVSVVFYEMSNLPITPYQILEKAKDFYTNSTPILDEIFKLTTMKIHRQCSNNFM